MGFFHPEHPVSGAGQFFGREQLLRSLSTRLLQGRSFALCGGPRTGRTSMLMQLEALIAERRHREPQAPKLIMVRVDVAKIGAGRAPQLFPAMWEHLTIAVRDPHLGGAPPPLATAKVRFDARERLTETYLEASRSLWQPLVGTPAWCRYVLMLDNIDSLLNYEHAHEVHALDALLRTRESEAPQAIVLTGGRLLREQLLDRRAPLHSARAVPLGILRQSEAVAVLRTGLSELDAEGITMMLGTTGRHPYLLQRIGAELEQQQGGFDVLEATRQASHDAMQLFEGIWAAFDFGRHVSYRGAYAAPEHALMQLLVDAPQGVTIDHAERTLGIRPMREHAEFLELVGVAEHVLHQDVPTWVAPNQLWNSWYQRRISY